MPNGLKKLLPFILPIIALILVIVVVSRWYNNRTEEEIALPDYSEGLEIENLSQSELEALDNMRLGVGNYEKITMTGEHSGEIRYEISDDKVYLTVTVALPETNNVYQLWLLDNTGAYSKSNVLTYGKGGFYTALAISVSKLPITLVVSEDVLTASLPENEVLRGTIAE